MSISNPELVINGTPFAIVPNSWGYDEGDPEFMVRAAVIGESFTQEFSENVEEAFSNFKFQAYPNVDNVETLRALKKLKNTNTVTATALEVVSGVEKPWRRTFKNALISNKPENQFGADTVIDVEWKSDAAV